MPPSLDKKHLSAFIKRIRARFPGREIRFFGCGEYGETFGRPHYHAILYGITQLELMREFIPREHPRTKELIPSAWPYGLAQAHKLEPGAIAYVAGYVAKKYNEPRQRREVRVDTSTGEEYTSQPPFLLMSRNPGIGWRDKNMLRDFRKTLHQDGNKLPAPRYLRDKYRKHATEAQRDSLDKENLREKIERLKADPRPLREQFRALISVNNAKAKAKQQRRTL